MGGVPVLVMMAVIGITYGWHPDKDGGVEYIIQVHPDEIRDLQAIGEVTSVIDPALRGHVSRVVFRVGDAELPQITPRNLMRKTRQVNGEENVANDDTPIEIPQLNAEPLESSSPLVLSPAGNSRAVVMKPQTANSAASGFSLPPVPPSLAEAAQQVKQAVDMAGRPIDPAAAARGSMNGTTFAASGSNGGILVPPPATRSATGEAVAAPVFTGPPRLGTPSTGLATSRAGGPTTDPTTNRDASWSQFSTPAPMGSENNAATSNVPSTLVPNNPFANRSNTVTGAPAVYGASPVAAGDTFGQTPAGLSSPSTGARASGVSETGQTNGRQSGSFVQVPSTASIFSKNQANSTGQSSTFNANSGAVNAAGNRPFGTPPPTSSFGQPASATAGQPAGSRFGINPSATTSNTFGQADTLGHSNPASAATVAATARPHSGLTAAQVAAGAWTVDAYGHPVDRSGRRVSMAGNAAAHPASAESRLESPSAARPFGVPRATSTGAFSSLGNPNPSSGFHAVHPVARSAGQPSSFGAGSPPSSNARTSTGIGTRSRVDGRDSAASTQHHGTGSSTLVSRPAPSLGASSGSLSEPHQVAAQPLFNGLLLISFVANIYLIFWLKNLRVQYHDLVAAKRMAGSGNPSTS